MGAVNGMRPDGTRRPSSEQSAEVWVGTTYALAAFMIGRGLAEEGWATATGAAAVTYGRGLWFRTPEAYDADGNYRASLYLRPLAIWAIEEALERRAPAPAPMPGVTGRPGPSWRGDPSDPWTRSQPVGRPSCGRGIGRSAMTVVPRRRSRAASVGIAGKHPRIAERSR